MRIVLYYTRVVLQTNTDNIYHSLFNRFQTKSQQYFYSVLTR